MKTPRDLLLERHQQQSPALDQLRERVIRKELGEAITRPRQNDTSNWLVTLRAWLNFQRAAWSGLAAVWCVILGLNLAAEREMGTSVTASAPTDSAQFLAGFQENRAQLAALLFDEEAGEDSTNRETEPGPRSDAGRIRQDARHLNTAFV
jgi:hypothetical protein